MKTTKLNEDINEDLERAIDSSEKNEKIYTINEIEEALDTLFRRCRFDKHGIKAYLCRDCKQRNMCNDYLKNNKLKTNFEKVLLVLFACRHSITNHQYQHADYYNPTYGTIMWSDVFNAICKTIDDIQRKYYNYKNKEK